MSIEVLDDGDNGVKIGNEIPFYVVHDGVCAVESKINPALDNSVNIDHFNVGEDSMRDDVLDGFRDDFL